MQIRIIPKLAYCIIYVYSVVENLAVAINTGILY